MKTDEPFPLRLGDAGSAAAIRAVLKRASFQEQTLSERLRIASLVGVDQPVFKSLENRLSGPGLLETLAGVFLFGNAVPRTAFRAHLTDAELDAFLAADLIRPWTSPGAPADYVFSPVRLVSIRLPEFSAQDLVVAGDRGDHPDGSPFQPFQDIVFPGHNPLTRRFLTLLPATRPASVLELCAGSGIAALAMALAGSRSVATDIAERSVHFARFNAWLNGCSTLKVACGDLYEAAEGRFDCIVVHPPYIPAFEKQLTYRDGGETGDEIIRGVVSGLPEHLNVGGTCLLLSLGMDTGEGAFEDRIRGWLGPEAPGFDIIFALDSTTPPELIATRLTQPFGGSRTHIDRWRDLFERLQVKEFVYGAVVIRRFDPGSAGTPFTRRVLMTEATSAAGFDRLLRWFDWLREPGGETRILEAKPKLPPGLRLEVQHRTDGTGFTPDLYFLENDGHPFRARLKIEPWLAAFLAELDGDHTVRELFSSAKSRGRLPEGFNETDQQRVMCYLAERNCVIFGEGALP